MKRTPRQAICNTIFFIKASLAVIVGLGIMALQGYQIKKMYDKGLIDFAKELKPVVIDPNDPQCNAPVFSSRLEPPVGKTFFGFHLDWSVTTPKAFRDAVGFSPAIFNAFLKMDHTKEPAVDYGMFEWHAQQAKLAGGMLAITIDPSDLNLITNKMIDDLAKRCYIVNSKYGVPLFLRFAHEMNGDWTTYGYQPTAFKSQYRKLGLAVRSYTNMTALVWGPNLGINYPFTSPDAVVTLPLPGTPDFVAMDTDANGIINNLDDPYLPYYPGDDLVDWVALSLYWYPDATTGYNILPPPTYFRDMAFSSGPSMTLVNPARANDPTRNFYKNYAQDRNKPFMIPETAAPYFPNRPPASSEAAIKSAWYEEIFSAETLAQMPNLKYVAHFEEAKRDSGSEFRDWRIASKPEILNSVKAVLSTKVDRIVYGSQFDIGCSGTYGTKKVEPSPTP